MDSDLRADITKNLQSKETEELIEIWQNHETDKWQEEVFDIIKVLLLKRLGYLPLLKPEIQSEQLLEVALIKINAGEYDSAYQDCIKAIDICPDLSDAYYFLGIIYEEQGQLLDASINFRKAISLDSTQKDYWKSFSRIETRLKFEFENSQTKKHLDQALNFAYEDEPDKALKECEKAKTVLPNISLAHNYLGLVLQTLGKTESAIEAYTTATQLNPGFTSAWENLSFAKRRFEEEQYFKIATRTPEEIQELSEMEFVTGGEETSEQVDNDDLVPGWYYMDAYAYLVPGTPGFRTRPGRSGYDQFDTSFEEARVEGIVIKKVFTGKLRTKNPLNLFVMAIFGLVFCLPLISLFSMPYGYPWGNIGLLILFSPFWVTGLAFWVNVVLSFMTKDDNEFTVFY